MPIKPEPEDKHEQLKLLAGTTEALRDLRQFFPRFLQFQGALHFGAAGTQLREAERLANKYGRADHPRVKDAAARAERMKISAQHLTLDLDRLEKVVDTFAVEDVFHGYVVDAKGDAVSNYTVRVTTTPSQHDPLSAKTDTKGYFRIEFESLGDKPREPKAGVGRQNVLLTNLARLPEILDLSGSGADTEKPPRASKRAVAAKQGGPAAPPPAPPATHSSRAPESDNDEDGIDLKVQIVDPKGKLVFEDDLPPRMQNGRSVLRYYALSRHVRKDEPGKGVGEK
ncbi:MAG TPA: carboxypeptidase-like regulatory domain-containing protein [Polyangiaceae bacterium]